MRRPQGAGPANAEVVDIHVRTRGPLAPMGVERGVRSVEQRRPLHRAAREEGRVESPLPLRRGEDGGRDGREHRKAVGQIGPERVQDARLGRYSRADATERRHGIGGDAVVVAEQHAPLVGVRPDHRDRPQVASQRQQVAVVLEQHDRFAGHLERQRPVGWLVEHADRDPRPAHRIGRVEHAEAEARQEQARDRAVDGPLADQVLAHCVEQARVLATAVEVGSRADGPRRRLRSRRDDAMSLVDVVDGAAIRYHVAGESPLAVQDGPEEQVARAGRRAEHPVVCAHQGVRAALANPSLEVRQVALPEVTLAHDGVELVPERLGTRVHGEVLDGRNGLQVAGIVALEPPDERHGQTAREVRVLTVGLLPASPSRVAEQVDVRRPDGETLISLVLAPAQIVVMLGAELVGNDRGHAKHQAVVPGRGEADRLRKDRRESRSRHAVETFVPPVVLRDSKTLDRGRPVHHLGDFLLERHALHEGLGPPLERQRHVLPGRRLCRSAAVEHSAHQCDSPYPHLHHPCARWVRERK